MTCIPDFLRSATWFNVGDEAGYLDLYRVLTQQPAVLKPALGAIRLLSEGTQSAPGPESETLIDDSRGVWEEFDEAEGDLASSQGFYSTGTPGNPPLAASGTLRDHAEEVRCMLRAMTSPSDQYTDLDAEVRRLRRAVRIDIHRLLSDTHPAAKNVAEVIDSYNASTPLLEWLQELEEAISEAAWCVAEQTG